MKLEKEKVAKLRSDITQDQEDLALMSSAFGQNVERITTIGYPSVFARSLADYRQIIAHNGAPDPLIYAKSFRKPFTIVDVGTGAGMALLTLKNRFPQATCIGIDVRNTPENKLENRRRKYLGRVDDFFQQSGIVFYQDSQRNIRKLVPEGYDLLLSVGSFFDEDSSPEFRETMLCRYYKGLHTQGLAEIAIHGTEESIAKILAGLSHKEISHSFYQGNTEVLASHALNRPNGIDGVIVLGPK